MKKRNLNLDIIRCLALFTLISVHFLLNNDFYTTKIVGEKMYIACIFRTLFMICVPLFLLLTGYLMNKKTMSKKYYFNIKKIIINYILAIFFIYIFKCFYNNESISIIKLISYILSFRDHAWYVGMYIGLYLLIPFLNIIYSNINKKEKKILILVCLFLTTLPSVLNIYDFSNINFIFSSKQSSYNLITINYWLSIYPITYYFIGCYLSEYKINISKFKNLIFIIISLVLCGTFNYLRSYNSTFEWAIYTEWGSFQNVLNSVLIFNFFINLNFEKINNRLKSLFGIISDLSYSAYLVSPIFEMIIYDKLKLYASNFYEKSLYFVITVPIILILSLCLSYAINLIYKFIINNSEKICKKINFTDILFKISNIIKNKIFIILTTVFLIILSIIIIISNYCASYKYSDGWYKYSNNPVLGDNNTGTLFDPNVMIDNEGMYRMYVSSRSNDSISVSISSDGINWEDLKIVLSPDTNSDWEEKINRCSVIYKDGIYHMWYTGQKDSSSKIGYATSTDGYNFEKRGGGYRRTCVNSRERI